MEFEGRVAVVTGASSGIGRATAEMLGAGGARVVVHYNANAEGARKAVAAIQASPGEATAVEADLRSRAGVELLKKQTHAAYGPIDILINNAGGMVTRTPLREVSEEVFDEVMDLNLKSLFLVTRAFLEDMAAKKKGVIVNMASIAGRNGGGRGSGVYGASKAGAMGLSKAMAKEFIEYGIRVNAVNPGIILTPFHERFTSPEMLQGFVKTVPLGRGGTPEEVAEVIVFLASERARYLVGETIEINGGQLMD